MAAVKHFCRFWFEREGLEHDLGARLKKVAKERPRERTLTLEEVRAVYAATEHMGPLWRPYFRILLLTLQRRKEVAAMEWSEIKWDQRRWEMPGTITKNGHPHVVPLSEPARQILESRYALGRLGTLVFTTTGRTPVSGFSKAKRRLDQFAVDHLQAATGQRFAPWTLHDLRRTFATIMNEEGAQEAHVDRVLNHVASASSASSVSRVYNRSQLLEQRVALLNRWAELVTARPRHDDCRSFDSDDDSDDDDIDPRILAMI
jgi:integrase